MTHEILQALYDPIVEVVHSGEYPVGYTELEELVFRNIDRKNGTSEFTVQFTAEHPKEEFSFNGHVEGEFRFDPEAEDKATFMDSLKVGNAREHFDMGDPDD